MDNKSVVISGSVVVSKSATNLNVPKRKLSLVEMMPRSHKLWPEGEQFIFNPSSKLITVGDIVRANFFDAKEPREGIVIEKVNDFELKIDFGEYVRECLLENCALLIRSDEFEVGDKVEARPKGSSLFFVGSVIKVHEDKSVDVLMDGDDPDDIEYAIPAEEARKLMSRRSVVANRWKKAFMLVVAANLFRFISFSAHGLEVAEEAKEGVKR
jgi:hypothetical protein